MNNGFQPWLLGALALIVISLAPTPAFADIIPPSISACRNAAEGDACDSPMRAIPGGTCVMARCQGKDYSNGPPPEYYYYACLKCLSAADKKKLEARIASGEVKPPDELPDRGSNLSNSDIEILSDDDADVPEDPPDLTDDEDDNEESDADAGLVGDAGEEEPDAASDDESESDSDEEEKSSSRQPAPDDEFGSSMLVTAGSIGLGLFFVAVGFWRRRNGEEK